MSQVISPVEPRFTFYRFAQGPELEKSALLFFFICPADPPGSGGIQATRRKRMMYPLMKRAVLEAAAGEAGLTADKRFEVEETAEITDDLVIEVLHPQHLRLVSSELPV